MVKSIRSLKFEVSEIKSHKVVYMRNNGANGDSTGSVEYKDISNIKLFAMSRKEYEVVRFTAMFS